MRENSNSAFVCASFPSQKDKLITCLQLLNEMTHIFLDDNKPCVLITTSQEEQWLKMTREDGLLLLNLLIAYKKAKKKLKSIDFDCDGLELSVISDYLKQLKQQRMNHGSRQRYQVIVKHNTHFTNLDIEATATPEGNELSVIAVDAANAELAYRGYIKPFLLQLKQQGVIDHFHWTAESIQRDGIFCLFFSLKLAFSLSQIEDLHTTIKKMATDDGEVLWSQLPLPLLKYCQSMRFLEKNTPDFATVIINKKDETLKSYIERHGAFFYCTTPAETESTSGAPKPLTSICLDWLSSLITDLLDFNGDSEPSFSPYYLSELRNFSVGHAIYRMTNTLLTMLEELSREQLHQVLAGELDLPLSLMPQRSVVNVSAT